MFEVTAALPFLLQGQTLSQEIAFAQLRNEAVLSRSLLTGSDSSSSLSPRSQNPGRSEGCSFRSALCPGESSAEGAAEDMKSCVEQQKTRRIRRSISLPALGPLAAPRPQVTLSWLILHALCCLLSLVCGFRFSRLLILLLVSPVSMFYETAETGGFLFPLLYRAPAINRTANRAFVGRHDILIRSWPHPNASEVARGHRLMQIMEAVQRLPSEAWKPKTVIAITPTYVRAFQALYLNALVQAFKLFPHDLIWIVIEAGGVTKDTASIIASSGHRTIHLGFDEPMPSAWGDRRRTEARMRIKALRIIREKLLDGVVVFADDSNIHSIEFFEVIQSVNWFGAVSMGILAHSGQPQSSKNMPIPIQGPVCDSSGYLVGWHTFNSVPYVNKSSIYRDVRETVLPKQLEWAGFVLNSKLLWKECKDKPTWVLDLDSLDQNGGGVDSPLSLLNDTSFVEPLGKCGHRALLWWLRAEAHNDGEFPPRWRMDRPLEVTSSGKGLASTDETLQVTENVRRDTPVIKKHPRIRKAHHSKRRRGLHWRRRG